MSLQFSQPADYFLGMPTIGSGLGAFIAATVIGLGTGCDERERLTFPAPSDGVGPVTSIDQPNQADTTIPAGADFFVNGTTVDSDGVDTVYFSVVGTNQNFSPFSPNPTQTTVRFGIPLTTIGNSGESIQIQIHGVDVLGNRGNTSTRQIHVQ